VWHGGLQRLVRLHLRLLLWENGTGPAVLSAQGYPGSLWGLEWVVSTLLQPLIKLSPKKTWEGFIGGFFATIVWSFWVRPRFFVSSVGPACSHGISFTPAVHSIPANRRVQRLLHMPPQGEHLSMLFPTTPCFNDFCVAPVRVSPGLQNTVNQRIYSFCARCRIT
jgi:Cytidylyltransferase family